MTDGKYSHIVEKSVYKQLKVFIIYMLCFGTFTLEKEIMLNIFGKRKIKADKLANILVNYIMEVTEKGYDGVEALIETSPEFVIKPETNPEGTKNFLLVVFVGNLSFVSRYFDQNVEDAIKEQCFTVLAQTFDTNSETLKSLYKEYKSFMVKVNHPSKNMLYAMSKGLFHKLELNEFQEDFFKSQNVPNPTFIKKLDEIMAQTIFHWDEFLSKHKVTL
tara:strand:+ start:113024 stop:113677 length:654 start_codon:yes stop_codon:yes gene_type:complete